MEDSNTVGEAPLTKKEQQQKVVYSFLEYLQATKSDGGLDEEALESVEVVFQCLGNAFGVNLENQEQKKFSLAPHDLPSILNLGQNGSQKIEQAVEQLRKKQAQTPGIDTSDIEYKFFQYLQALKKRGAFNGILPGSPDYETRYIRARQKFMEKFMSELTGSRKEEEVVTTPKESSPLPTPSSSSGNSIEEAENFKNEGNKMLSSKQYIKAIEYYTKAIELNSENAVYYCNRAAAFSHMGQHQNAVDDCKISIKLNPKYSKAYGRLGLAYFSLGKYAEAVTEYKKALELEPTNTGLKESLVAAEKKLQRPSTTTTPTTPTTPPPSPSTNSMFNNPDFMNQMGNLFGSGGIQGILSNPMFQTMAQQMMNNPDLMNMANNLMQNPEALNSMMRTMGQSDDSDPNEPEEKQQ